MNRSDRTKREAERAARRARRLADRAEQRARHKAEQAARAAKRAEDLAERARHKSPRHRNLDRTIEDFVDDVTEKWTQKAEDWIDDKSRKLFEDDSDSYSEEDLYGDYGMDDADMDGTDMYGTEASARRARQEADEANRIAAEAEARVKKNRADDSTRAKRQRRSQRRRTRTKSDFRFDSLSRRWKRRNRNGNLYRDKQNKKVCGVCAGLADYWGMEVWKVRMLAVFGIFFVPSVTFPAYFIAYFLMDDKPYYRKVTDRFHELDDEEERREAGMSRKARRSRSAVKEPQISNAQALAEAKQKFSNIEDRLRSMESHVTSPKFELQRELKKIAGDD